MPQDPEDISTLNNIFKAVTTLPHPRRAGEFDAFVYNDKDKRESREVAELTKKLESLKVVARAKVNQNRIYSAAYHPEISKDLVFFGGELQTPLCFISSQFCIIIPDKHGELGIWDARAAPEEVVDEDDDVEVGNHESGRYWQLQLHWPATSKSSISSIRFDPVNAHNVSRIARIGLRPLTRHSPRCILPPTTAQYASCRLLLRFPQKYMRARTVFSSPIWT